MKKIFLIGAILISISNVFAQRYGAEPAEKFGGTFNLGIGVGNYRYVGHPMPALVLNYEFDIARNLTLAPFVGFYTYTDNYYWGNHDYPYRNYNYRGIVVPVGVKVAYYFDELLHANKKWDFYAAGSIGFAFNTVYWDNGYYGDKHIAPVPSPLFAAPHVGARLHFNDRVGMFLDLSTGLSTFGFSFSGGK